MTRILSKDNSYIGFSPRAIFAALLAVLMLIPVAFGFPLRAAAPAASLTAQQCLSKAVAKVKSAGGMTVSFSLSGAGGNMKGTLNTDGRRFSIVTGGYSTWYDGKSMWTYNPQTSETTLTTPTSAELSESNPLLFINAGSRFNVAFSKTQTAGVKTLVLTPKSNKEAVRNVILTLNSSTWLPSKITVTPKSGGKMTLTVTSAKTGKKFAKSAFTYPRKQYPKVPVVDLR